MTTQQNRAHSQSYTWLLKVKETQKKWPDHPTLWAAYPFKKSGLTRPELYALIDEVRKEDELAETIYGIKTEIKKLELSGCDGTLLESLKHQLENLKNS